MYTDVSAAPEFRKVLENTNNKHTNQSELYKTQETQSKAKHVMMYTKPVSPVSVCVCVSVFFSSTCSSRENREQAVPSTQMCSGAGICCVSEFDQTWVTGLW